MATPTAQEQYMLELVNRARSNPNAEANRFGIDLNQGLASGTLNGSAKQPLVFNFNLIDSARSHSQWMLDTDQFSHTGANGSSAGDRMRQANYEFTGNWTWGENIAYQGSTGSIDATATIADEHEGLFKSSGHRTNILSNNFSEIGIGALEGNFDGYNSLMTTQNFAKSGNDIFLTGVAFDDAVTDDDFYTVGEGLGGINVIATNSSGQTFSTTTYGSGGYQLALAPGTYEIDFTGGNLGQTVERTVTVGNSNVKLDLATDQLAAPSSANPPANAAAEEATTTPPATTAAETPSESTNDSVPEPSEDTAPLQPGESEAPMEETPMEEAPAEETVMEETPVEETAMEETPVEETPMEEVPMEDTSGESTPMDEGPMEGSGNNPMTEPEAGGESSPLPESDAVSDPAAMADPAANAPMAPEMPMDMPSLNLIEGTDGRDRLQGTSDDDELHGMEGRDRLFGRAGDDLLMGGKDHDRLNGGRGADTLIGADTTMAGVGEIDILRGGAGGDRFVLGDANQTFYDDGLTEGWGANDFAFIRDFNASQGDIVQLHGEVADYSLLSLGSCGSALFHGEDELIAIVKSRGNEAFALDSSAVQFV